jgi:hypothetical protein
MCVVPYEKLETKRVPLPATSCVGVVGAGRTSPACCLSMCALLLLSSVLARYSKYDGLTWTGVWVDPMKRRKGSKGNYYSWAGYRIMVQKGANMIDVIGTDDGEEWWSIIAHQRWEDDLQQAEFEFTPILKVLKQKFNQGAGLDRVVGSSGSMYDIVKFASGLTWYRVSAPNHLWEQHDGVNQYTGLFFSKKHHVAGSGSFAGTYFISGYPFDILCIIGTDDGERWWSTRGVANDNKITFNSGWKFIEGKLATKQDRNEHDSYAMHPRMLDEVGVWRPSQDPKRRRIRWADGDELVKLPPRSHVLKALTNVRAVAFSDSGAGVMAILLAALIARVRTRGRPRPSLF